MVDLHHTSFLVVILYYSYYKKYKYKLRKHDVIFNLMSKALTQCAHLRQR